MGQKIESEELMIVKLFPWLAWLYMLTFKINIPLLQVQPSITRLRTKPPANLVLQDTLLLYFLRSDSSRSSEE